MDSIGERDSKRAKREKWREGKREGEMNVGRMEGGTEGRRDCEKEDGRKGWTEEAMEGEREDRRERGRDGPKIGRSGFTKNHKTRNLLDI